MTEEIFDRRRFEEQERVRVGAGCGAMGLPVGSGVVESACGVVVADHLKRGGMRWTVKGANAMPALRCRRPDGRLDDFQPAEARPRLPAVAA